MPPNIPCTSGDGNPAVIIVSSLMPGDDLPTQSLCMECAPAFFAAMLQTFTGVDVTDWLYSQIQLDVPSGVEPDDQADDDTPAEPDPPAPTPLTGRTRSRSPGAGTAAGAGEGAAPASEPPAAAGA